MEIALDQVPAMPDFSEPQRGFHHTVDSALEVLASLGISSSRVTVRMAGPGYPPGWVIDQEPPASSVLRPDAAVSLSVAGVGFFQSLPAGFWDQGGEAEPGTKEIVELFDDPIQKAAHWIREGARLFDIGPQNYADCARWISLFGADPEAWPRERWYRLALLLPALHRLAGREEGIRFGLKVLFDLPLAEIRYRRALRHFDDADLSLLGAKASRLAADFILGDCVEDLARMVIVIGPVTLDAYNRFQEEDQRRQLDQLFALCLALNRQYRVSWSVLDRERAPRLGTERENSRLGVNSHLGRN